MRAALLKTGHKTCRDLREVPKCDNSLLVASNTYWALGVGVTQRDSTIGACGIVFS